MNSPFVSVNLRGFKAMQSAEKRSASAEKRSAPKEENGVARTPKVGTEDHILVLPEVNEIQGPFVKSCKFANGLNTAVELLPLFIGGILGERVRIFGITTTCASYHQRRLSMCDGVTGVDC